MPTSKHAKLTTGEPVIAIKHPFFSILHSDAASVLCMPDALSMRSLLAGRSNPFLSTAKLVYFEPAPTAWELHDINQYQVDQVPELFTTTIWFAQLYRITYPRTPCSHAPLQS